MRITICSTSNSDGAAVRVRQPISSSLKQEAVLARIYTIVKGAHTGYGTHNCHTACAHYIREHHNKPLILALFKDMTNNDNIVHSCIIDRNMAVVFDVFQTKRPHIFGGKYYNDGNQLNGAELVYTQHLRDVYKDAHLDKDEVT